MAKPVEMPRMGYDMTEGKILRWIKHEGDAVNRGDTIAEIETDKVNIEIEAFDSGVLKKIIRQEGEMASVGDIIAVIGAPDEQVNLAELGVNGESKQAATAPTAPAAQPEAPTPPAPTPAAQPEAPQAQPAATAAPSAAAATAPLPEGPLKPAPGEGGFAREMVPSRDHLKASPIARRLAEEHGVNLAEVSGTGPNGRIVRNDVENYIRTAPAAPAAAPAPAPAPTPAPVPTVAVGAGQEVALSRMRQTIARRTAESKQQAPHFYLTVEVHMDEALKLRQQLNQSLESEGIKLSVNDLVVKATAKALAKHRSIMNASFAGDKIIVHPTVDVGIAVALEEGLISPVLRNADVKALSVISQETRDLAARAQSGTLRPDEYSGGTFTISNLGMYHIDEFVAIIVQPQAGILAVGEAIKRPIVRGDELTVATTMKLTLSADHRVADGAQAAVFLNEVRRLLENPMLLLV